MTQINLNVTNYCHRTLKVSISTHPSILFVVKENWWWFPTEELSGIYNNSSRSFPTLKFPWCYKNVRHWQSVEMNRCWHQCSSDQISIICQCMKVSVFFAIFNTRGHTGGMEKFCAGWGDIWWQLHALQLHTLVCTEQDAHWISLAHTVWTLHRSRLNFPSNPHVLPEERRRELLCCAPISAKHQCIWERRARDHGIQAKRLRDKSSAGWLTPSGARYVPLWNYYWSYEKSTTLEENLSV